jgi:DNA-binding XRE family transcriptional regulator
MTEAAAGLNLRATLRVRNNDLVAAREQLHMTQAELAKSVGIPVQHLQALEALRFKRRAIPECARKVAQFLELDPERVVPLGAEGIDIESTVSAVAFVPTERLLTVAGDRLQIAGPEELVGAEDLRSKIRAAIDRFPPKIARIVKSRFGLDGEAKTFAEIADEERLSRERVRQILCKFEREVRGYMGGGHRSPAAAELHRLYREVEYSDKPVVRRVKPVRLDHDCKAEAGNWEWVVRRDRWEQRCRRCQTLVAWKHSDEWRDKRKADAEATWARISRNCSLPESLKL